MAKIKKRIGFTLIELLAVIVILAIIGVIATMKTRNIIKSSERDSFKITAEFLIDAADKYYVTNGVDNQKVFDIQNGAFISDPLNISGNLPENGTIELNSDGSTAIAITDGTWCARKNTYNNEVTIIEDTGGCLLYNDSSCFEFSSGTITGYNVGGSCGLDVYIPRTINSETVTSIADNAFSGIPLTSVTFPNTLTQIGTNAFFVFGGGESCGGKLTSIYIPDSVTTIKPYAFTCNPITDLYIGAGLESISITDEYGYTNYIINFYEPNLKVEVSPSNLHYKSIRNALYTKDGTSLIVGAIGMENNIESTVTTIEDNAFEDKNITSVTIPSSVTKIGAYAFSGNQLSSITIPSGVTTIEDGVFSGNQLTSITIPSTVTTIGNGAFAGNQLTSLIIPNTVTSLGGMAFYRNQLTSVTISNGITEIGYDTFSGNQLTSVTIPSGVTTIGWNAFYNNKLTSVTLSDTVTSIQDSAFALNQLSSITIPSSVTSLAGFNDNKFTTITIPGTVTRIESQAFANNQLTSATISQGVTYVGYNAFNNNKLTSVNFPTSITYIDGLAFNYNYITQGNAIVNRISGTPFSWVTNAFNYNGDTQTTNISPTFVYS